MQLVHPFMGDHEVYARGGKVLLDGGRLYTDFIDVKPPLIYELFALCIAIGGESTAAVRLLDVCLQIVVVVLLFITAFRYTASRFVAYSATIAFGLYITSLWMSVLLHPETLAFLPIMLLIRLGAKVRSIHSISWLDAIVLGVTCGVLFSLKYTLVLAAVPVAWMFMRQQPRAWKRYLVVVLSFIAVVGIVFGLVWYDGIIAAMRTLAEFVAGYGAASGTFAQGLSFALGNIADFFANDTSLLLTGCVIVAIVAGIATFKVQVQPDDTPLMFDSNVRQHSSSGALFSTTLAVFMALVFSLIIERKFGHPHFPRLLPPLALLVGFGFPVVYGAFVQAWRNRVIARWSLVALLLIALVLSPLPRFVRTVKTFVNVAVQGQSWRAATNTTHDVLVDLNAMDSVIAVVKAERPRSVVVLGLGGTLMYWFLPDVKKSKFADAHFITAPYAPAVWNAEGLAEARAADVVVMQADDVHPRVSGHNTSTRYELEQRPEWRALFAQRRLVFDDGKWSVWLR